MFKQKIEFYNLKRFIINKINFKTKNYVTK